MKKKIYTFRPYYIDTERLFDVYSTVMDGYCDEEEVVEIVRNNTNNQKKGNGIIEFSVTSFINKGTHEHNKLGLNGNIDGNAGVEWRREDERGREFQKKITRKLSPCVLLNWMLDRMVDDKRILETTTRWLHRPRVFSSDDLGFPVVLEGIIRANSTKTLTRLNVYPKGIRGVLKRIVDRFSNDDHEKVRRKRKYILLTKLDHEMSCVLQQLRIELALLKDMFPASFLSPQEKTMEYSLRIQELISQLEAVTQASYLDTMEMMIVDKEKNILSNVICAIASFVNDCSEENEFSVCVAQIKKIHKILEVYQMRIKKEMYSGKSGAYGYVFDLKESMYYGANEEDILNSPSLKCLGLIKGVGMKMYELEVIALYQ